ncbi:MAG TPA: hypothetical protein VF558_11920 [Rubrobacteraceae bacterium]
MKRKAKIPGEVASQPPASSGCLDFRVDRAILAASLADATNLGLSKMASASADS